MTKATPKKQRKVIAPQPGAQELAMNTKVDFLIYGGAAGCVDADTEFLSQDGWKKISEYVEGDRVFQYDKENDTGSFVIPEQYVKLPCEKLTRISGRGIDQCLSDEHRVLLWPTKESAPRVHTLWEIKTRKITGWMKSAVELSGRVEISRTPEVPLDSSVVFEEYPTRDGFKYCFSVPSGFFLIRRNGNVVLTGNSGKSHLLLMHPLQYARDPNFKAVFFRESTALLMGQGGLWQEATKMYADFKCKNRLKPQLTKEFSSGAVFQFMHMQHEDDKYSHKGLQLI